MADASFALTAASVIAAVASAVAAGASALAAFRVPINAATYVETLQQDSERRRNKLLVFATLMEERAAIYSEKGVSALNLVDVVYNDCEPVREAWARLYQALDIKPFSEPIMKERLFNLLSAMAADLKLADKLRPDDLARIYAPEAIVQSRAIKDIQRAQLYNSLTVQQPPASNATTTESPFPPKPE